MDRSRSAMKEDGRAAPMKLSVACGVYDRVAALAWGEVAVPGLELDWVDLPPEVIFWRMLRHKEFDACEMSLSSYLIARDQGSLPACAIPVFPSRRFRHSCVYVRTDAGIREPSDLSGRRIGVPEFQMSAALWMRGILHDDYGVLSESIEWVTGGQREPGRRERIDITLPKDVRATPVVDTTLEALLEAGELDGLLSPEPPQSFHEGRGVARLFTDPSAEERAYYRRTGTFPIMHTFIVAPELLAEAPWVARSLYEGFCEAKSVWYSKLRFEAERLYGFPWIRDTVADTLSLMGDDFWPYGLEANRLVLETAARYSFEQGLVSAPITPDEMFVAGLA